MKYADVFKCDFCHGRKSRENVEKEMKKANGSNELGALVDQKAMAILDRTSIHPEHYCRIVVTVSKNGSTIKQRYIQYVVCKKNVG